jgi:PiT family inorganic phosphate transporter
MVSFARGLNDTPKIAGILLLFSAMGDLGTTSLLAIGVAMAVGGLLSARRVAERMSWKITDLNVGQGMAANVVTSFLVLGASRYGVPVSTTHVSCGALFGIGAVTGQARWTTVASILLAWVVTLPVAAATAATAALVYRLALAAQTTF